MRDRKEAARTWVDRRAGSYEGGFTSRWRDPVQRASLDALQLAEDDRLLDLGCGTGWAARAAASMTTSVVGVDLSPEMIREATSLATGIDNVRFEVADAERLPFGVDAFTAVLCSNAFHHSGSAPGRARDGARAGLSEVMLRRLTGGAFAIVRAVAA